MAKQPSTFITNKGIKQSLKKTPFGKQMTAAKKLTTKKKNVF